MAIELTSEDLRAIGSRIRTLRETSDLTQAALAERIHVTQPAISAWERGEYLPSFFLQNALADALRTRRSLLYREAVAAENRAIA